MEKCIGNKTRTGIQNKITEQRREKNEAHRRIKKEKKKKDKEKERKENIDVSFIHVYHVCVCALMCTQV